VIMPESRPSAAATRYGLKCCSKNDRIAPASCGATASAAAQGACQTVAVAGAATRAAQPARNAGHASSTGSADQPGSALNEDGAYVAGSDGAGGAGVGGTGTGGNGMGVATAGGATAGGAGSRGADTQPARIASAAAINAGRPIEAQRGRGEMGWFLLETLVALLIAVAIVGWTMGFRRRKRSAGTRNDTEND
jgi:cobalamin biosynthesis Mg chelatase CobN